MQRSLVLILVLLFSLPATAGSVPQTGSVSDGNGPADTVQPRFSQVSLLVLGSDRRSHITTTSVDVSSAVTIQTADANTTLNQYALESRLESATTDEKRIEILQVALVDAQRQATALRESEASLRQAYGERSISSGTFARELAENRAQAEALETYLTDIARQAEQIDPSIEQRAESISGRLTEFQGPVREKALIAIRGQSPPVRLYVSASPNGTVLSTIADGRIVREAYRDDRRSDFDASITIDQLVTIAKRNYPVVVEESQEWGVSQVAFGIYRIELNLPGQDLNAYVDGRTQQVYYEVRRERLNKPEPNLSKIVTANGTRLVVNRTYRGGPLRIATYDSVSGEAVEATVLVEAVPVATGTDGVAWTLAPDLAQFTVTVVRPAGNVTTTVRTVQPAGLANSSN